MSGHLNGVLDGVIGSLIVIGLGWFGNHLSRWLRSWIDRDRQENLEIADRLALDLQRTVIFGIGMVLMILVIVLAVLGLLIWSLPLALPVWTKVIYTLLPLEGIYFAAKAVNTLGLAGDRRVIQQQSN